MNSESEQVNLENVVAILREKLNELTWRTVLLETRLAEMRGELVEAQQDKMRIAELEYRLEELTPTPGGNE